MRFNELKKYKDSKTVKPRDPNWKQMQDIKKSGAAGSHGDKTKVIPRKQKHQDTEITEAEAQVLTELAFLPFLIPALATGVRLGAPHVLRFLGKKGAKEIIKKGAQGGAGAAANIAKNAKPLIKKGAEAAGKGAVKVAPKIARGAGTVAKGVGKTILKHPIKATILGVGAKIYMEVDELIDDITELVGDMLDSETIKALAQVAVKYAIPAVAIVAILYGGKKLYDYISDDEPEAQPQEDIQAEGDHGEARLLGVAEAHLGYGLEMAQHVLNGDKFKSESMAKVIVDGWPDAIDKIHNVYKTKTNGENIQEFIDDRVGTVVKTSQGKRVKILQADPKNGVYKVEFQNGTEVFMSADELDLEVPTDALGKETKPRDWKHPWDSNVDESSQAEIDTAKHREKMATDTAKHRKQRDLDTAKHRAKAASDTAKNRATMEDLDSKTHKAYQSMWHKANPIGSNWMNPDDYDADAEGTHIIMDQPTELHFYKVPAKNYDEAFDKWLDGKSGGDRVSDHEFYDSTKDYASEHQYWGRIAPDEPEEDDWSDEDEKEFGTAKKPDEQESLTNEEIAKILEADFDVKDLEDYREKVKTLYGLERYMQSDPELAAEVKRRYRQLAKWKIDYDKTHEENYEQQIYDGIKNETATAGATSAGNIATVVNPKQAYGHRPKDKKGLPKAPQKKKADGTAVNALDMSNNLMGGATVSR